MEQVIIIGNGISGITAALHIRKLSGKSITVISAETDYFFSRTALMYVYMGHLKFQHTQPYEREFWEKNKINLACGYAEKIDPLEKKVYITANTAKSPAKNIYTPSQEGEWLFYDQLIIASGSKPNRFGWKGENLEGVQGMYSKQDLDMLERRTPHIKQAVIVGGGLIGIELAEMLRSRGISVTFLVREKGFWNSVLPDAESALINRHIIEHGVDLKLGVSLREILPGELNEVRRVVTDTGEEIPCQFVGLTAGVSPNIGFLDGSGIETRKGILVNRYLETNISNVYAIGDCAEQREPIGLRKAVEAIWYTGRIMGETVAQVICGNRVAYNPGHWFNSAKFFDIEYQTYGWVWAKPKEYEAQLYWEATDGKKCIRISYHKETRIFLGIHALGIRLRQAFFEEMLTNQQPVTYMLSRFKEGQFDPELFHPYYKEAQQTFATCLNVTSFS
jgi:NADH oxidase (H2O2-forming)